MCTLPITIAYHPRYPSGLRGIQLPILPSHSVRSPAAGARSPPSFGELDGGEVGAALRQRLHALLQLGARHLLGADVVDEEEPERVGRRAHLGVAQQLHQRPFGCRARQQLLLRFKVGVQLPPLDVLQDSCPGPGASGGITINH